jgi:BMFP domain-containing protein YqiC
MQTQSRLLDDLARVASGALGVAAGMRGEVDARLREQFERVLARFDLVTREEFDAVKAMAVKAREEQEDMAARLAALEAALAARGPAGKAPKSASKPAAGKPARKARGGAAKPE